MQILIIDDEGNLRRMLRALLESEGYSVGEAESAEAGLSLTDAVHPEVILLDLALPGISGLDALAPLSRACPGSPIIMMSGHAEKHRVYAARDAGVTEFLVKPITAKAILDRINAVIFRPRPFVKTATYFGPCRRRREADDYCGPFRRSADGAAASNAA